ncbi:MAG: hypothetical protein J6V71_03250 [Clostridia bacterium]|nr:hypothetical protein [Clostridia bacterium]
MLLNAKLENQKNKNGGWTFAIYTIITMCVYILPALKIKIPYVIAGPLMLISLLVIAMLDDELLKYSLILVFISFCFFTLNLMNKVSLTNAINEMIRNIRFFLPVIWCVYCVKNVDENRQKVVLFAFLFIAGFIMIKTLTALAEDAMIARLLAQGKETSDSKINSYRLSNIGGFEFSYMMGVLDLCSLWVFLNRKEVWVKIISIGAYILIFYYIIQAQYTTLLLLTFVGSVVLLFAYYKNIWFRILLVFFSVLLIYFIGDIFSILADLFSNVLLGAKFDQLAEFVKYGSAEELGSRPELIRHSFETWLMNPILGADASKLNSHSLIMSTLAGTGLVGFSLLAYLFYKSYKLIDGYLLEYNKGKSLFKCSTLFLIALAFFNPIGYVFEMTIITYFILPICIKSFANKEQ